MPREQRVARKAYRRAVWGRAWKEARSFGRARSIGFTLVAAALGILAYGSWEKARGMSVDLVGLGIATIAPPVALVVGEFFWQRIKAPAAIHQELRMALQGLTGPQRVRLVSEPFSSPRTRLHTYSDGRVSQTPSNWRFHISQGKEGVDLECTKWALDLPPALECWVEDPSGKRWRGSVRQTETTARCTYPTDFPFADEYLTTGRHTVEWLELANELDEEGNPQLDLLVDPWDFRIALGPDQ